MWGMKKSYSLGRFSLELHVPVSTCDQKYWWKVSNHQLVRWHAKKGPLGDKLH